MALTKEVLQTYKDGLQKEYEQTFASLQAIHGGIQVVNRMLRYLELEESGGEKIPTLADVF